jgi:hypothetical protein
VPGPYCQCLCRQNEEQGLDLIAEAHILIVLKNGAYAKDITQDEKNEKGKRVDAPCFYDPAAPPANNE